MSSSSFLSSTSSSSDEGFFKIPSSLPLVAFASSSSISYKNNDNDNIIHHQELENITSIKNCISCFKSLNKLWKCVSEDNNDNDEDGDKTTTVVKKEEENNKNTKSPLFLLPLSSSIERISFENLSVLYETFQRAIHQGSLKKHLHVIIAHDKNIKNNLLKNKENNYKNSNNNHHPHLHQFFLDTASIFNEQSHLLQSSFSLLVHILKIRMKMKNDSKGDDQQHYYVFHQNLSKLK